MMKTLAVVLFLIAAGRDSYCGNNQEFFECAMHQIGSLQTLVANLRVLSDNSEQQILKAEEELRYFRAQLSLDSVSSKMTKLLMEQTNSEKDPFVERKITIADLGRILVLVADKDPSFDMSYLDVLKNIKDPSVTALVEVIINVARS